MLSALGTGNHDLVPYAACLMLELYQDGTQFFVEVKLLLIKHIFTLFKQFVFEKI